MVYSVLYTGKIDDYGYIEGFNWKILEWLKANNIYDFTYSFSTGFGGRWYYFVNEEDAVAFKLRWL